MKRTKRSYFETFLHKRKSKVPLLSLTFYLGCTYSFAISITNVLKVARSYSRLLENSIATSYLFVYNVRSCCVYVHCVFVIYLFHYHTDVVVRLLMSISMYINVRVAFVLSILVRFHLRNTIYRDRTFVYILLNEILF